MSIDLFEKSVVVFLIMTLTDFVWGKYTTSLADKKVVNASLWSMGIILLGSLVTRAYVEDYRMIVPCMLGAFAGTWISLEPGKS